MKQKLSCRKLHLEFSVASEGTDSEYTLNPSFATHKFSVKFLALVPAQKLHSWKGIQHLKTESTAWKMVSKFISVIHDSTGKTHLCTKKNFLRGRFYTEKKINSLKDNTLHLLFIQTSLSSDSHADSLLSSS